MDLMTLHFHTRQALEYLIRGKPNPPIGRFFWLLTRDGIRYVSLPPKVWSPAALGLKRVWPRGPSLYDPISLEPLKRIRIWVSQKVTTYQIEEWIKPYRGRRKSGIELVELGPRTYRLKLKRCYIYDYLVKREIGNDLDRVMKKMNGLPYKGVWSVREIDGEKLIMFERKGIPTILLNPRKGVFYGVRGEGFHIRRMEQTSATMLSMLSKYFPEYVRFYRETSRIPDSRKAEPVAINR